MEQFDIYSIDPIKHFPQLSEIPQPPVHLYIRGNLDCLDPALGKKIIAVVGSRKYSSYGKAVCQKLISDLRGYPVVIISGLALGIDSIAHQAAIDANIPTISFPGSGLGWSALYPSSNRGLAEAILESGGALLSEYDPHFKAQLWNFPQRNRLMAGIADITLVIEAQEKSGTLITARLATEYNKTVGAVPGNITSPSSKGTNWLLRLGATPITSAEDILLEIGIEPQTEKILETKNFGEPEKSILEILQKGPLSKDDIIATLADVDMVQISIALSMLEIEGYITESLGLIEIVA
jgi:DNA processing protein